MLRPRYRPVQAVVLVLLSALVTACAAFAPLYDRAMQQALVAVDIEQATIVETGLQVTSASITPPVYSQGRSDAPTPPPAPEDLLAQLPAGLLSAYQPPVLGLSANVIRQPAGPRDPGGPLVWLDDQCAHLMLMTGRCPTKPGDVLVSPADARVFELPPGSTVKVDTLEESGPDGPVTPTVALRVVGSYRQLPGDYWFGLVLTGRSGTLDEGPPAILRHDVWLTTRSTLSSDDIPLLANASSSVSLPLDRDRADVDDVEALSATIEHLIASPPSVDSGNPVRTLSGITDTAVDVGSQRAQSRITVPLLMAQLGLLAVVVLWLTLLAATDQRRPEVALARLRGRGRRGAGWLLLSELLPLALLGVPLGAGAAVLGCWWARTSLLPGGAPYELGQGFFLAAALAVVLLTAVTSVAVIRVAREPVDSLLRRVPPRRASWALGVADALVVAAAMTALVAVVTGGLNGPLALATPALLAVVVGLLLAHLSAPLATLCGRRLLARGWLRSGLSVLDAARSPTTRRTITVVTLASALLVFSADAFAVGARNREYAAAQEAGANRVAVVVGSDLADVRAALREVDPSGNQVTPVVTIAPPGDGSTSTVAVEPEAFRRIALFPGNAPPAAAWQALQPPAAPPIALTGARIRVVVRSELSAKAADGSSNPVTVGLALIDDTGQTRVVDLDKGSRTAVVARRVSAYVGCRDGCLLTGVTLEALPGSSMRGTVRLSNLTVGPEETPVPVGPATAWTPVQQSGDGSLVPSSTQADQLTVRVNTSGVPQVELRQASIPRRLPALVTGTVSGALGDSDRLVVSGLDAVQRDALRVGTLARVPASSPGAALVNLDVLQRSSQISPNAAIEIWFAVDDSGRLAAVTRALEARGIALGDSYSLAQTRRPYDESTAAWSLQLAALAGAAGLVIALLMLVILAVTTWRLRSRDLAALRMSGVRGRWITEIACLAPLPAIAVAVVAGTLTGLGGADLALSIVPLFATAPQVSTLDLSTSWFAVALAAVTALVVLALAGALIGRSVALRSRLPRLREPT